MAGVPHDVVPEGRRQAEHRQKAPAQAGVGAHGAEDALVPLGEAAERDERQVGVGGSQEICEQVEVADGFWPETVKETLGVRAVGEPQPGETPGRRLHTGLGVHKLNVVGASRTRR
ncbi:hypothetical protein GCM10009677_55790 [Sphaerisporangium rubeum]